MVAKSDARARHFAHTFRGGLTVGAICKTVHRSAKRILGGILGQKLHRHQDQEHAHLIIWCRPENQTNLLVASLRAGPRVTPPCAAVTRRRAPPVMRAVGPAATTSSHAVWSQLPGLPRLFPAREMATAVHQLLQPRPSSPTIHLDAWKMVLSTTTVAHSLERQAARATS